MNKENAPEMHAEETNSSLSLEERYELIAMIAERINKYKTPLDDSYKMDWGMDDRELEFEGIASY